jgi:cAMP-binding proteins - catabolite gene activator and regulatory subunit of cAMP-dependent protein kinases
MMVCLISQMGQIINDDENRLQRMVTSSATHRVKQALMLIAADLGTHNESGKTTIPYPITLKEIARVSGTTRETAGQVVSKLVDEGVVVYQHKNFQFNPELLT